MRIPRPDLVARVVSFLHNNVGEPVTVAEMSGMAGVSERTLRAAFRDVVGLSPKQYAITERLRAAHDALCAADPKTTTVTDIAMAFCACEHNIWYASGRCCCVLARAGGVTIGRRQQSRRVELVVAGDVIGRPIGDTRR